MTWSPFLCLRDGGNVAPGVRVSVGPGVRYSAAGPASIREPASRAVVNRLFGDRAGRRHPLDRGFDIFAAVAQDAVMLHSANEPVASPLE